MRALSTLSIAVLLAACSQPGETEKTGGQPAPSRRAVATIEGVFDGSRLTLRQVSTGPATATSASALVEIPVVQDGTPGSNPPDTIELVTEDAWTTVQGCGVGVDSLSGLVTIRSFYPHRRMSNTYVEILQVTPAGHEACNSASPAPAGTTNQFGLFPYGVVDHYGSAGNAATAVWRFRLADRTPFVFTGRVVADVLDDTTPPTTRVVGAPPGVYPFPVQLATQCDDGPLGSGCKETHYTTDGSTPTLASPVMDSPWLSHSTTVKLFSVDWFGNEEPVQTLTYVIDQTPPAVVATSPAGYGVLPDGASPIVVTFSEPVVPASVTIQLRDGYGMSYGPFAPDATGTSFQFQSPPYFPQGTILTLEVTAARDLAGNTLASPFTTRFAVAGVQPLQAATGPATIVNEALVSSYFTGTLALYSEWSGDGSRLYAVYRPDGQGWHPPVLLDAAPTSAPISARVHDTAWGFLVAWSTDTVTRAALFSGASDGPDWTVDVFPTATRPEDLDPSQVPGGLAVARAAGTELEIAYGDASGTWGTPITVDHDDAGVAWPRVAWAPPTEAVPYALLRIFYAAEGKRSLRVVGEDPNSLGYWAPSAAVPGAAFMSPLTIPPLAFESPAGVEVVWAPPTGGIRSAEQLSGQPFPTWNVRVLQAEPTFWPNAATELVGTGSGDYRAIGWFSPPYYGAFGSEAWGSFFYGGAWSPAERITTYPASQLALGGNYHAALVTNGDPHRVDSVLVDPVAPSTLSTLTWSGAFDGTLDWRPEQARSPRVEDRGLVTWAQQPDPSSDALWSSRGNGFAPELVGTTRGRAEALAVSAVVDTRGDAGAIWMESSGSGPGPAMAYAFTGGFWFSAPPYRPANLYSGVRAFASGAAPFATVAYGQQPADAAWTLAVLQPGSGYEAFSFRGLAGAPEVAAAGHPDRAIVAYSDGMVFSAAVLEGGQWWPYPVTAPAPMASGPMFPSAAAGGSGVLVGWRNTLGRPQVADPRGSIPPATFSSSLGMTGPVVAVGDRDPSYFPRAAAAWLDVAGVYAVALGSAYPPGWGTPSVITAQGASCGDPQLASDGTTFLAVFACDGTLLASRFDGTAWSAPFPVAPAPLAWSLAGSPGGYRVALVRDDGGVGHAYQVRIAGTSAGAPERLDQGTGTVRPAIRLTADTGFFCAAWSQVVDDPYAAQPRARCFLE
jgi:hypothetical protein